jgi:hypothetical protein
MTIEEAQLEIDRLTAENTREKDHRAAADRTVGKHLARVKELEARLDPDDPLPDPKPPADPKPDPKPDDDVDAREKRIDRRERILTLAIERGIDPATALSILEGDDSDRLDAYQESNDQAKQDATDRVLKANGRNDIGGGIALNFEVPSMAVLESDAKNGGKMWRNYSPEALADSAEAATAKPTLRQRLADRIGGSR